MAKLNKDQKIPKGESDFHYSKNTICCKWYDNNPVLLLGTNVDGMSGVCNVMRRTKGSATKAPASCPNIKLYNNDMGGVDIIDQKNSCLTEFIVKASITFT